MFSVMYKEFTSAGCIINNVIRIFSADFFGAAEKDRCANTGLSQEESSVVVIGI